VSLGKRIAGMSSDLKQVHSSFESLLSILTPHLDLLDELYSCTDEPVPMGLRHEY